jgi:hypothetical protein
LALAHEGANPGQLGQLYRTAGELGLDLPGVQAYLDQGVSLHELRQAARLAEQSGGDLTSILEAGVRETRRQQQEERRQEHQDAQSQQQLEQDARAAARLAERYGVTIEQVQALFDGACGGDWNCVQATLRDQSGGNGKGHGGGKP